MVQQNQKKKHIKFALCSDFQELEDKLNELIDDGWLLIDFIRQDNYNYPFLLFVGSKEYISTVSKTNAGFEEQAMKINLTGLNPQQKRLLQETAKYKKGSEIK